MIGSSRLFLFTSISLHFALFLSRSIIKQKIANANAWNISLQNTAIDEIRSYCITCSLFCVAWCLSPACFFLFHGHHKQFCSTCFLFAPCSLLSAICALLSAICALPSASLFSSLSLSFFLFLLSPFFLSTLVLLVLAVLLDLFYFCQQMVLEMKSPKSIQTYNRWFRPPPSHRPQQCCIHCHSSITHQKR